MAKLSAAARKKLPAKDFAGPNRTYPVEDKAHARAAIALRNKPAGQGHQSEILAAAKAVLSGKKK